MKHIFTLFCLFIATNMMAQDMITTRNGEIIKAKIIEVTESEIKYKRFDIPDGPNYILKVARVASITYQNGVVEGFKDIKNADAASESDASADFFINATAGLSAPISAYQSFDKDNNSSGAAESGLGITLDIGGTFPRTNFGWLVTATTDKHAMNTAAAAAGVTGATTSVTSAYTHSGALVGVSYRVPIGSARSNISFYAQLGYVFSALPSIETRVEGYYGPTSGRRSGSGQGLAYNAGFAYRHNFTNKKLYFLAKINYQAAGITVTGAEIYSSIPWAGDTNQFITFPYSYSVVNAQVGVGFFLK